jgi:hypothetical protein
MAPTPPRRKRPHPARRSRRAAGSLSVVALAGLTGGMAAATKAATSTATASTSRSAPTSTATSTTAAPSGDDDSSWSTSSSAIPVAGSAASQPVTSSHAS